MEKRVTSFTKLFGSGPSGLAVSLVLFGLALWLNKRVHPPPLSGNRVLLDAVFLVSVLVTLAIIIWSARSLPTADRGNRLCTSGAFRHVRHPLYAAFISVFDFGLAIYLNSYIFIMWAVLVHLVWHYVVRYEEQLMVDLFGETYREYERHTGRFLPRLLRRP